MKLLFVDNHADFTATVIECFLRDDEVVVVPTIAAAKERFQASQFDVVFVDYDLDDGKGDELVRWLRARDANAKIIAVSAREIGNEALVAAGANTQCPKPSFARIHTVLKELVFAAPATSRADEVGTDLHKELLSALHAQRGLLLVAGPTGHGKTTAIERVLSDLACPPNISFVGDLRGDLDAARHAVSASRSCVVVAVLRIPRAAGAFRPLLDMQIPSRR